MERNRKLFLTSSSERAIVEDTGIKIRSPASQFVLGMEPQAVCLLDKNNFQPWEMYPNKVV